MTKAQCKLLACSLAFCSLAYEFMFIKAATAVQGGQIFFYNLTLSLFTFSLGLGSLVTDWNLEKDENNYSQQNDIGTSFLKKLVIIEGLLFLCGICGPILITYTHSFVVIVIMISLVGFFSGFELPLLFKLYKESDDEMLAWDYIGMFLSSLLIPLVFLPYFGLGATALFSALLNLSLALFMGINFKNSNKGLLRVCGTFFIVCALSELFFHESINNALSKIFLSQIL